MSCIFDIKNILYASILLSTPYAIHAEDLPKTTDSSPKIVAPVQISAQTLMNITESSFKCLTALQNTIIQVTMLLQKYGTNIDRKADAVKELQDAVTHLEGFIQLHIKPVAHYFQQDLTTVPAEAYQEICEAFDALLKGANELLITIKKQIRTNFKEPLNIDFLIAKKSISLHDDPIDPNLLLESCAHVMQNCADVFTAGTTIGLTKWNKAARVIDRYIVQPCARYHILPIVGIGGFATGAALFTYWLSNCEGYYTPERIAERKRNDNINKGTPTAAISSEVVEAAQDNTKKDSIQKVNEWWFTWIIQKVKEKVKKGLGPIPDLINNRWTLEGAPKKKLTLWNQSMCVLYNSLPGMSNPITNLIGTGVGYVFGTYVVPIVWPFVRHSTTNWWQSALGGASAEVTLSGTWEYQPDITLEQVIGLQHVKDLLAPAIAYAANPEKYAQTASAIPTNYILYGLRRTGKSFFAKAISGTMKLLNPKMKVLNVPCDAFRQYGVTQTIDLIRSYAPCVAFIDEVDLGNFARSLDRQTTGELLKALGEGNISPDPSRPVFLFFATNKLEAIDTSLASLGRFGAAILFTNPSLIDRLQFIFTKLQSVGLNPQNFDVNKIAEKTEGNSLEEIAYCITLAKQKALGHNEIVSTELIMATLNEILYGIYPEFPHELHKEALNVLSAHFAGKALACALTESNEVLDTVSICRRKLPLLEDENAAFSGKPTRQPKYNYGIMLTRKETVTEENAGPIITKAYYMRILAGVVAEEMILGKSTNQCHAEPFNDDSVVIAYRAAIKECSEGGLYWYFETQMGDAQKAKFFAKAEALIEGYKQEVRTLLEANRRALEVIIRALKLFGTLHDGVVLSIIENPEAVAAHIDEIEKQQEEEYKRRVAEHQAATTNAI